MVNPILQMLNQRSSMNNLMGLINMAKGNPWGMYNNLMRNNPQFRQFVNDNRGKSAEQIAQEHGIDLSMLKDFMK